MNLNKLKALSRTQGRGLRGGALWVPHRYLNLYNLFGPAHHTWHIYAWQWSALSAFKWIKNMANTRAHTYNGGQELSAQDDTKNVGQNQQLRMWNQIKNKRPLEYVQDMFHSFVWVYGMAWCRTRVSTYMPNFLILGHNI